MKTIILKITVYQMRDLGITPKEQALKCLKVAKKYLDNVNLGNKFLLQFS